MSYSTAALPEFFAGNFELAVTYCEKALELDPDDSKSLTLRAIAHLLAGELDEADHRLLEIVALIERSPAGGTLDSSMFLVGCGSRLEIFPDAELPQLFTDVCERALARLESSNYDRLSYKLFVIRSALARSDKKVLTGVLAELADLDYPFPASLASKDAEMALVAAALGRLPEAEARFEAAVANSREAGYAFVLGGSLVHFSDFLIERNASGDREKAAELQDEAIAIAQKLGMKPLLERVLAQREILKA